MAVYKVPQNVEAEDKLLGPFSFKQFVFLVVSVGFLGAAWALFSILPPLAIVPLPIAVFFGALALPLRKDQPMEVYFAALISFILKPKRRLWKADGVEHLVEVIAPHVETRPYGKGFDRAEVDRRLTYLATLVDSRGWSVRGVNDPNSSMRADLYNEAVSAEDPQDSNSAEARRLDQLISRSAERRRTTITSQMQQAAPADPPSSTNQTDDRPPHLPTFSPYPTMQQSIITPLAQTVKTQPAKPLDTNSVSPAIIDLARNHGDLSVASLQREANRISRERGLRDDEEVTISLH